MKAGEKELGEGYESWKKKDWFVLSVLVLCVVVLWDINVIDSKSFKEVFGKVLMVLVFETFERK